MNWYKKSITLNNKYLDDGEEFQIEEIHPSGFKIGDPVELYSEMDNWHFWGKILEIFTNGDLSKNREIEIETLSYMPLSKYPKGEVLALVEGHSSSDLSSKAHWSFFPVNSLQHQKPIAYDFLLEIYYGHATTEEKEKVKRDVSSKFRDAFRRMANRGLISEGDWSENNDGLEKHFSVQLIDTTSFIAEMKRSLETIPEIRVNRNYRGDEPYSHIILLKFDPTAS